MSSQSVKVLWPAHENIPGRVITISRRQAPTAPERMTFAVLTLPRIVLAIAVLAKAGFARCPGAEPRDQAELAQMLHVQQRSICWKTGDHDVEVQLQDGVEGLL